MIKGARAAPAQRSRDEAVHSAYSDIQRGQRLIFGENTYIVGVKSKSTELPGDLPEQVVRKLEDALATIAADPGEPFETEAGAEEDD